MSDLKKYFAKVVTQYQGSREEKLLADLLFDDALNINMGDQRLNAIAALTYNTAQCRNIFNLLLMSLNAQDYPWKTLYKALMVYHTIVLFGSEIAIDLAIQNSRFVLHLSSYNSALVVKPTFARTASGTDFGAPVRMQAAQLLQVIETDSSIRHARAAARQGQDSLVPMGTDTLLDLDLAPPPPNLTFGQGVDKSIGAGFDLSAVPGMYENRPDRYFDNVNDKRKGGTTGDHQFTREAMNPDSLLDLAFGDSSVSNDHLPAPDYLPALEKQRELEALLAQQQEQLRLLQAQQMQAQQQPRPYGGPSYEHDFLSMSGTPTRADGFGYYSGASGGASVASGGGSAGSGGGGSDFDFMGPAPPVPSHAPPVDGAPSMSMGQPQQNQYRMQGAHAQGGMYSPGYGAQGSYSTYAGNPSGYGGPSMGVPPHSMGHNGGHPAPQQNYGIMGSGYPINQYAHGGAYPNQHASHGGGGMMGAGGYPSQQQQYQQYQQQPPHH